MEEREKSVVVVGFPRLWDRRPEISSKEEGDTLSQCFGVFRPWVVGPWLWAGNKVGKRAWHFEKLLTSWHPGSKEKGEAEGGRHMCVFMLVGTCVYMCVCCVCRGQKLLFGVIPQKLSALFFEIGL